MSAPAPRGARGRAVAAGLASRLIVLGVVALIVFALPRALPGDPLTAALSPDLARDLDPGELAALRARLGLDGSWWAQLSDWVEVLARGDLGFSVSHARPVAELLTQSLPWTLLLILAAMPVYLGLGTFAGIVAGCVPGGRRDRRLTFAVTLLASIPPFLLALLMMLGFAILWPVLPASGALPLFPSEDPLARAGEIARHAVLPALALAGHEYARFDVLARAEAARVSGRPFMMLARARGLSPVRLLVDYEGRNVFPAILARLSDSVAGLVSAVVIVEIVFSYPGVGGLIYGAILARDYALLQGTVITLATVLLALNWMIDAATTALAERG